MALVWSSGLGPEKASSKSVGLCHIALVFALNGNSSPLSVSIEVYIYGLGFRVEG